MRGEIRVGVVGAGFWATEMHMPALQSLPHVRLVAVASRSAKSASAAAERFGIPRSTADYMELLDDPEIDVIDIVAPNDLHAPVVAVEPDFGHDDPDGTHGGRAHTTARSV